MENNGLLSLLRTRPTRERSEAEEEGHCPQSSTYINVTMASPSIASTLGQERLNGLVDLSNVLTAPLISFDFFVSETLGASL